MSELKECGWCGSEAHRHSFLNDQIKCNNDKCPVSKSGFHREMVWNNRPAENKIKADGILQAVEQCTPMPSGSPDDFSEGYNGYCEALYALQKYANKLEKGDA